MADNPSPARICFIEMMGIPGSYDASVYDHLDDRDQEGQWFIKRYRQVAGIAISTANPCLGEPLPAADAVDGLVLAGTYNSVHDHTDWQLRVRAWLPEMRSAGLPLLAICGSHQLLAHMAGAGVERLADGPCAGTLPLRLTEAGRASPLLAGIADGDRFNYANSEHVVAVPQGAVLLGHSERVPVAALDFGDHWYSTQFHPEGTDQTLGIIWRHKAPHLMQNYDPGDAGDRLVENFLRLVRGRRAVTARGAASA